METMFTIIYTLEVIAKVNVFGWKAYTEIQRNVFDFSITVLAVVSTVIVYYPNSFNDSRIIRMIILARVLRLVRLLMAMKRFQLIGKISAEILPAATNTLLVLFCLMYFFAALGMQLYGGFITRDPDNAMAFLVLNTDFSENDYWANNFNDMISGMNVSISVPVLSLLPVIFFLAYQNGMFWYLQVLFNLLVVNNWTECEIGYEKVTQSKLVRLFFLGFHIFGVILVNNLVIAFVITSFLEQLTFFREADEQEVVGDGEAVIHHRRAIFEASQVTGTSTNLSGDYIARLRHNINFDNCRDKERLRLLFTQTSSQIDDKKSPVKTSNFIS
jgi:hypothetical protein